MREEIIEKELDALGGLSGKHTHHTRARDIREHEGVSREGIKDCFLSRAGWNVRPKIVLNLELHVGSGFLLHLLSFGVNMPQAVLNIHVSDSEVTAHHTPYIPHCSDWTI